MEAELARCDAEQEDITEKHGPEWLRLLGWADWEIERELITDAAANSAGRSLRGRQRAL